ncbi:MAG: helix-turn-helix transcriptional regulator [Dehalococcoidia bacterium]
MSCAERLVQPTERALSPSDEFPTSSGFVGRQREMRELNNSLDDALSGRGRLVMLVGEPGIGKTRTSQELAAQAMTLGVQVHWGRCYEEQGAPPYWPWLQVLHTCIQQRDPEQLRSETGAGAADIAEIVSELREKLSDLEPPPALEPEQARFRLFNSITTFLKNASQSQPLMLVLDDLHWADKPSLLLLQFLARDLGGSRLLVVGNYRNVEISRQHPLSDTLAQLSRESSFQRHLILGLSREETNRFLEVTSGTRPSPRLIETIYSHTEGNPFFISELTRLLLERGELGIEGIDGPQGIQIPDGVREVIGQRLNRLTQQCNDMLITASIIGREFRLEQLSVLIEDLSGDRLLEVAEEALAVGVIEELPQTVGHYQFTHALIQDTLAGELTMTRKAWLHARIAAVLEELYGSSADVHASELAHHFAQAKTLISPEKLVHYSRLAGEQALEAYAHEEALAHFLRALAAKEVQITGTEPAADDDTAALLFGLGRAQAVTLRGEEALTSLNRAFNYYVDAGNVPQAVTVAEHPDYYGMGPTQRAEFAQLNARALALVSPDSHEAGRLLCHYGQHIGLEEGDYDAAESAFGRALTIAQSQGDASLEMHVLVNAVVVDVYHLRWAEATRKGLVAIELARQVEDPRAEVSARYFMVSALTSIGDLDQARLHTSAMLSPAERLQDRYWLAGTLWKNEVCLRLAGEWENATDFCDRGLTVDSRSLPLLSDRTMLAFESGDLDQGHRYFERLLEVSLASRSRSTNPTGIIAFLIPSFARVIGIVDQLDIAREAAESVLSSSSIAPIHISRARAGLGLLAVHEGAAAAAAAHYAALLESSRGILLWFLLSGDRLLGLLSQTMGNLDQASAHFEDALAFCRKAGYRPELAWTCHDYAHTLLQRHNPGDGERAMFLLDESLFISTELGMRPLMERIVDIQGRVEPQPELAPAYPDGLTQREVEVLHLVAVGKSNPEIAEELFISLNTVARHVSNIFIKIGASNRVEAATYASGHGLVQ